MTISAIVAIAENNAIGKDNQLLWHLPNDLKHFRMITTGHTVIMGRKTFDSVGQPLPKRRNIVVTRQDGIQIEGCEVVNSVDAALAICADEDEVFIVGGAEIYKLAMPKTDRIYLTIVHQNFAADAFFPQLDINEWTETGREEHDVDDKHAIPYTFLTLQRR